MAGATRLKDGSEIHFPESYQAKNLAQGAPTEILDINGNRLELKRDGRRNLQQILTPHGHWIKFQYDDQSRITRADDDAGNWTQYAYDVSGMLADVVLSSGRERHYSYDKLNMTKISDEKGNLLLRNWYDGRALVRQEFRNSGAYVYYYRYDEGQRFPKSVTVILPDSTRREVPVSQAIPGFVRKSTE